VVPPSSQRSGCLSDATILSLGRGDGRPGELDAALSHLDACPDCAALVAHAVRHSDPDTKALGRYQPVAPLGSGAMGDVVLAFDPVLDRAVAVKIHRERGYGRAREGGMLREARAMAALDHPNVVKVLDIQATGNELFVAMEYIEGQTLGAWLDADRSPTAIVEAFIAAGRGLAAAHAAGVVHGDFKPSNVMVSTAGRVVVVDFGLARPNAAASAPADASSDADTPTTQTATDSGSKAGAGTPHYMAPEQYTGRASSASDQYALCLALGEALAGRPLFGAESLAELAAAKVDQRWDVEAVARLPRRWRHAVMRGLSASPADRFVSMDALLRELTPPAARTGRIAVAAAALALIGVAIVMPTRRADPAPCSDASAHLDGVWDEARRTSVTDHLGADAPAVAALQRYADAWLHAAETACRDALDDPDRAATTLDPAMRCLQRRLDGLQRTTDAVLGAAPDDEAAAARVDTLAGVDDCLDPRYVALRFPLPGDPAIAEEVFALERRVDAIGEELMLGNFERAEAEATAVEARARALPFEPLLAQALWWKAEALAGRDDDAALAAASEAYEVAQAAEDDLTASQACMTIIGVHSDRGAHDAAKRWIGLARMHIERTGEARSGMRLSLLEGALAMELGEIDQAIAHATRALEGVAADDPESLAHATILVNLGGYLRTAGRDAEAIDRLQEAERITIAAASEEHFLVPTINSELGTLHSQAGEHEAAIERCRRAVELDLRLTGGKTRYSLHYRRALAVAHRVAGQLAEAQEQLEITLREVDPTLVDAQELASVRSVLADVLADRGKHEAARQQCGKALAALSTAEASGWADAIRNRCAALAKAATPDRTGVQ